MINYITVFIFGTIVGSFLNVCIYRLPLGKSIVWPGSFCPRCKHPIKWFDNIPLVSFLVLRGKCRHCADPISIRYIIVELVTALSAVAFLARFGVGYSFFAYELLLCALIVIVFIDIDRQEIPDVISLPGIFAGVALMTVLRLDGSGVYAKSFANSVLGVLAGGGSMFLMGVIGGMVFRKEALGGGDVKLMAMIGAFLGWELVLLTFFMAPVLGSVGGLIVKIKFKKDIIAYGPYLSIAAAISLLYGRDILRYLFLL
ncbi:MAG: prepilin peptidase [Candidatus Omnitrophota bacterium]